MADANKAPERVWVAAEIVDKSVRGNDVVKVLNWGDSEVIAIVEPHNVRRADLSLPAEMVESFRKLQASGVKEPAAYAFGASVLIDRLLASVEGKS